MGTRLLSLGMENTQLFPLSAGHSYLRRECVQLPLVWGGGGGGGEVNNANACKSLDKCVLR